MLGTVDSAIRDGVIPESKRWPVAVAFERYLGLVLRQWVQEPPNATLAIQLQGEPAWRQEASRLGYILDQGGLGGDPASDRLIARRLHRRGLPDTPATVRHLRAVLDGKHEPLPARGLLVTTSAYVRVFQPPDGSRAAGEFSPPHGVAVTGSLDLATSDLWREAGSVAHAHREWLGRARCPAFARLRGVGYYALADPRARSRAHPTAELPTVGRDPDRLDYLAEAFEGLEPHLELLARLHPAERGHRTARYLKQIADRVARRRRRAGVPVTPDPGWQDAFRRAVDDELHR
jgi:hypothetical protein